MYVIIISVRHELESGPNFGSPVHKVNPILEAETISQWPAETFQYSRPTAMISNWEHSSEPAGLCLYNKPSPSLAFPSLNSSREHKEQTANAIFLLDEHSSRGLCVNET